MDPLVHAELLPGPQTLLVVQLPLLQDITGVVRLLVV
jgi:hypothetical protein